MWVDNDLTKFSGGTLASIGGVEGSNPPALDAYTEEDGSQHVNFMAGSHVDELYRSPDPAAQWADNDLSDLAHEDAFDNVGPIDGYSTGDGSQHVNVIHGDGHVHELYRSPDPAVQWAYNDLTALAIGGTPANITSRIDGYSQADDSQHVNFVANGHVHELYRNPNPAAQWVDNDLTGFVTGTVALPRLNSPLDGYGQADGSQHVNFIDAAGHVHELYRNPNPAAQWVDNDLSGLATGPPTPAAGGFALNAYAQEDGSQHVNFIDDVGHVHELYRNPNPAAQWVHTDLTAHAIGGTPAALNSPTDGYSQADGSQHVNFIDAAGHVHELYRSPDPAAQWVDTDLTAHAIGGTPATMVFVASPLDGYAQADGSQHVNFIDAAGHVHELYHP